MSVRLFKYPSSLKWQEKQKSSLCTKWGNCLRMKFWEYCDFKNTDVLKECKRFCRALEWPHLPDAGRSDTLGHLGSCLAWAVPLGTQWAAVWRKQTNVTERQNGTSMTVAWVGENSLPHLCESPDFRELNASGLVFLLDSVQTVSLSCVSTVLWSDWKKCFSFEHCSRSPQQTVP